MQHVPSTHRRSALLALVAAWACSSSAEPVDHPPDLSLALSSGAPLLRGDTLTIEVTAADAESRVATVQAFVDGASLGTDSESPYLFQWNTAGARIGSHVVGATARDDGGRLSVRRTNVSLRWPDVAPDGLDDGWATAAASAEGINAERIADMMAYIADGGFEFLHALLIVRHGKLVAEEYFGTFTRDSLQHLQSTTKSFTSALIGIAVDRGEIGGVDDPMWDYLPEYASLRTAANAGITIEDCLMMAAGLEWNEITVPTTDARNDNIIGHRVADYVAYVLGKPVVVPPGTQWYYNSGCSMTLGAILKNATGLPADSLAEQVLFGRLGIASWVWERINSGKHVGTHGSLYLRARDMAKFGQLFLQQGVWDGEQLISAEWVEESTRPRLTVIGDVQYGYQWWFKPMDGYAAPLTSGYGGQHIIFIPALDAVIVTAADYSNPDTIGTQDDEILALVERWIVPAMGS